MSAGSVDRTSVGSPVAGLLPRSGRPPAPVVAGRRGRTLKSERGQEAFDDYSHHLRTLFHKFGVEDLPQNQKRAKLVELAFRSGLVSERTL